MGNVGLYILFGLGYGSDYNDGANTSWENYAKQTNGQGHAQNGIVTTNGTIWYLTGVQLELVAVSQLRLSIEVTEDEIMRCYRYFQKL